jgi:competence protein ComEC
MTGFIIMPLIVVFLLLIPFGLEFLITPFLREAIEVLIKVSSFIASLPGAAIVLPEQSPYFLILFVGGGLWFCLWQERWRYLGWGSMLTALAFLRWSADPVIVIPDKGQVIYIFDGTQAFSLGGRHIGFREELFLRQVGCKTMTQLKEKTMIWEREGIKSFLTVEKLSKKFLRDTCEQVDYLFSPRSIWYACPDHKKVIDRFNILHTGTMIAQFKKRQVKIIAAGKLQGCRPWSKFCS